ncbi:cellulase [Streptomyces sp. NPDC050698]
MDDFERDLSRLMRDTQRHTPYEPAHRQRLHAGIRARRRSRLLWKAGGSAVAVAGLSVGLALLPGMITRAQPADPRPATSPTTSPDSTPTPGPTAPSPTPTEQPETPPPATTSGGVTPSGTTSAPTTTPPTATAAESRTGTTAPPPSSSPNPTTAPPSAPESEVPSASASIE